eukprot:6323-Heterococcus_DN1.PRE.1
MHCAAPAPAPTPSRDLTEREPNTPTEEIALKVSFIDRLSRCSFPRPPHQGLPAVASVEALRDSMFQLDETRRAVAVSSLQQP